MDHRATESASAVIGHPAAPMLDLQPFCSTEASRHNLHKPFSHGGFSYATDGSIAVRVARRADIADAADSKIPLTLESYFDLDAAVFERPELVLPGDQEIETKQECEICDGRGVEHECPSCECKCDVCDGSGEETIIKRISVDAFGRIFRLKYLRQMLALPGIEIDSRPSHKHTICFRFDGGVGALMACSRKLDQHIEPREDAPIT